MDIIFATTNTGKLAELQALPCLGAKIIGPLDLHLGKPPIVDEDLPTYEGNALKKARVYFDWARRPIVADDSGLEVVALGGLPGVFSARYGGTQGDSHLNITKLLENLRGVKDRRAVFVGCLAFISADGESIIVKGELHGRILESPKGPAVFGYDPIFEPEGTNKSLSEIKLGDKTAPTHRTRAFEALIKTPIWQKTLSAYTLS